MNVRTRTYSISGRDWAITSRSSASAVLEAGDGVPGSCDSTCDYFDDKSSPPFYVQILCVKSNTMQVMRRVGRVTSSGRVYIGASLDCIGKFCH